MDMDKAAPAARLLASVGIAKSPVELKAALGKLREAEKKYLNSAVAVHVEGDVVFCHAAPVFGSERTPIPLNFEAEVVDDRFDIEFKDKSGRVGSLAGWASRYNTLIKDHLDKLMTDDADSARMLVGLAGPKNAGVTNSNAPAVYGHALGAAHLPTTATQSPRCLVHGHIPNAFGIYVREDTLNERMSLDTQYSANSVAFGLLLSGNRTVSP
jgi:hypothetical protein